MPRIVPDGPELAVSPDSAWIALVDQTELSLHDARTQLPRSRVRLPVEGPTDVLFGNAQGQRVVFCTRTPVETIVGSVGIPDLDGLVRRELPGRFRLLACVGERALLAQEDGDTLCIATLGAKGIAVDPLVLRGPVRFAAPAPEDRLLVETRGQLEFWDLISRRALFRVNLALPPSPRHGGFAGRGRLLWVTDAEGHFEAYRFSDGRRQLQLEIGGQVLAADGRVDGSRVVVVTRGGDPPTLGGELLDFMQRERMAIELEPQTAAIALVDGPRSACLITVGTAGELRYVPLESPEAARRPPPTLTPPSQTTLPPAAAPPIRPAAVERPAAPVDRQTSWRARLSNATVGDAGAPRAPAVPTPLELEPSEPVPTPPPITPPAAPPPGIEPPPPVEAPPPKPAAPSLAEQRAAQRSNPILNRLSRMGGGGTASAPAPVRPPTATPTAPPVREEPPPPTPRRSVASVPFPDESAPAPPQMQAQAPTVASAQPQWREGILAWAQAALSPAGATDPPPVDGATPLGLVARRFALPPQATRALALLYGAWLLGDGERGLAPAQLARAATDDADWSEALGRGALARGRLVRSRHGRVRIVPTLGRLLDGHPPRSRIYFPEHRNADAPPLSRAVLELGDRDDVRTIVVELAKQVGRAVAVLELAELPRSRVRRRAARTVVEARLFDAVPFFVVTDDDFSWLNAVDDGPLVLATRGGVPDAIADLPRWSRTS